jgi:hypothetical protein
MNNKKNTPQFDDDLVASLVQSTDRRLPEALDDSIRRSLNRKRSWWLYPLAAAASVVLAVGLWRLAPFGETPSQQVSPVTEIRTQFEISEQNIKIIWVQKQNFDPGILSKDRDVEEENS